MSTIKFSTSAAMLASAVMPGAWVADPVALHSAFTAPVNDDAQIRSVSAFVPSDANAWSGPLGMAVEEAGASSHHIVLPEIPHWNRSSEKRFKELAVKESLAQISPHERKELDELDQLRERDLCPPSGEEFIRQQRGRQVTAALIHALQEYVRFYGQSPAGEIVGLVGTAHQTDAKTRS